MRHPVPKVAIAVGSLLLLTAAGAVLLDRHASATGAEGCNGHAELCDRPYDQVAFPATHNSMAAADDGWSLPEQPDGILSQLQAGIRVFLIDSWYGQATSHAGVIATTEASRSKAQAELTAELGGDVVAAALRARGADALTPTGVARPYLCHARCELGSVLWEEEMTAIREWVVSHPRDVVTFVVQDEVTPADTDTVFKTAGLLPYVHAQAPGAPWPTLRQLITSGQRVLVFMENHGGGSPYPWLMRTADFVQDTPYDNPTKASLSCNLGRGSPDASILLVNHWVSGLSALVSTSRRVNERGVLLPHMRECERERGQLPNFVAVDYYNLGDLLPVVDELNGFAR